MAEIRKDIVSGNLVIISPQRSKRPHDFKIPSSEKSEEECPFCPGNESMTPPELYTDCSDKQDVSNWDIRSIPNLYSPLSKDIEKNINSDDLYEKYNSIGTAEVFIETPDHDSTLGVHPFEQVVKIIRGLKERYTQLKQDKDLKYIQIFKNFGPKGGASKEHAHWQIMSLALVPPIINNELAGAGEYYENNKSCVYCDIINTELKEETRIVINSENFISFCPYASRFAFETLILPKQHKSNFEEISEHEIKDIAYVLQQNIKKLEDGFNFPPYNIVLHTLPFDLEEKSYYHWHLEILPRLNIFAGFEWGTGIIINPTSPELAAQSLTQL